MKCIFSLFCSFVLSLGLFLPLPAVAAEKTLKSAGFIALSESSMNMREAKIFCQQQGGRLPRINNSDKMAFETAQDNKITHIDGIGAPGEPWPSVLPTDNYWTGTESLEYHGNWWVIVRDRGGNVNVLINNQRQNLRVVCVP